ncbi:MAG: hypothetical protein M3362_00790 [Acidobacteriota bacterium]|nr:hypothetical protein [Acidobacteriota bacterium]
MKPITSYSKGRISTFLFSLLSTVAFYGGAVVTVYVMVTGQDRVITDLLTVNFKGSPGLTGLLGKLLVAGGCFFLLALLSDFIRKTPDREQQSFTGLWLFIRHLTFIRRPAIEQEYIIGDLMEEFSLFESRSKACFWLFRQVIKSTAHLILKTIQSRLASMFGRRIL